MVLRKSKIGRGTLCGSVLCTAGANGREQEDATANRVAGRAVRICEPPAQLGRVLGGGELVRRAAGAASAAGAGDAGGGTYMPRSCSASTSSSADRCSPSPSARSCASSSAILPSQRARRQRRTGGGPNVDRPASLHVCQRPLTAQQQHGAHPHSAWRLGPPAAVRGTYPCGVPCLRSGSRYMPSAANARWPSRRARVIRARWDGRMHVLGSIPGA
jgi:hypothetical protein